MNPFGVVAIALLIFIGNLIYSAYSVKVLREHSRLLSTYKDLKEENLKLRAEIERMLNVRELERYAIRHGFRPFSWEEFALILFTEPEEKDRSKERGR